MSKHRQSISSQLHARLIPWYLLIVMIAAVQAGCIQQAAMVGKVLMGEPKQPSGFELATGVSLLKDEKSVLIHCAAPSFISAEHGTLAMDLEEELNRRLKRRGLLVVDSDAAASVLDHYGGAFDPQRLATELDGVDYIVEIEINKFTFREHNSPNLYRGQASGRVIGYEVRGAEPSKHAVQVYDQEFEVTHPSTHPIAVDQMPQKVFIARFVDKLADHLGNTFYSVTVSDLFTL